MSNPRPQSSLLFTCFTPLLVTVLAIASLSSCSQTPTKSHLQRFGEIKKAKTTQLQNELILVCDSLLADFADSSMAFDSLRGEILYAKARALKGVVRISEALVVFIELQSRLPESLNCTEMAIISHLYVGYIHLNMDENKQARQEFLRAIEMAQVCGDEGQGFLGRSYVQLANYLANTKPIDDSALVIAQRAKSLAEDVYGQISGEAANAWNTLGLVYEELNAIKKAKNSYLKSIEIYSGLQDKSEAPTALGSLGFLYIATGERYKALKVLQDAKKILDSTRAPTDYVFFRVTSGLALTQLEVGQIQDAADLMDSSLALIRSNGDLSFISAIAEALVVLAKAYMKLEEFSKADDYISQGLNMLDSADKGDQADAGKFYELRAKLKHKSGDFVAANQFIVRTLEIYDSVYGIGDVRTLPALSEKARIARSLSNPSLESRLYDRIEALATRDSGMSFVVTDALEAVVQHKRRQGKFQAALKIMFDIVDGKSKRIQLAIDGLQERQAIKFFTSLKKSVDILISTAIEDRYNLQRYHREVIDAILLSKAITTESLLRKERLAQILISSSGDERTAFSAASSKLAGLINKSLTSSENASEVAIKRAKEEKRLARERLTLRVNQVSDELFVRSEVNLKRVQAEVDDSRNVLLEYFKYRSVNSDGVEKDYGYIAYLLKSHNDALIYDLGVATPIDSLIGEYRQQMYDIADSRRYPTDSVYSAYAVLARDLYCRILHVPIGESFGDAGPTTDKPLLLIISPDDDLYLLPFGALLDKSDTYLIERIPIHYVSTARTLMEKPRTNSADLRALIVANPSLKHLEGLSSSGKTPGLGSKKQTCIDFDSIAKRTLPFTKLVGDSLTKTFSEQGMVVDVLVGEDATESNFKRDAESCNILHLATHGYFIDQSCLDEVFPMRAARDASPLALSGILLAKSDESNAGVGEDGILTSAEVTSLNLSGVRIVALSSCESGVGLTAPGESVYGLRRSFLIAGAKTVLSALWEVDDRSSTAFFTSFYASGYENFPKKIQQIKKMSIERIRKNNINTHPFIWGGFISFGDWR